nr:hypothetical protein [Eubacterium sp.]
MEKNANFKERLVYVYNHLTVKERVVWVLQMILTIVVLVIAMLGIKGVYPIYMTNVIDLVLLMCLFVVSGIKFVPERIIYAIIYFVLALVMGAILVASFFI